MAIPTRLRPATQAFKEPDPFALDASSEEFFASGDRPTPVVEKIELELEEEDIEVARRSTPEVVMRRRRYRRLVSRVVSAVGLIAIAALAKSALTPANASAFRPTAVAMAAQPVRVLEPPPEPKVEEIAKADVTPPPPVAEVTAPAPEPAPAKVARHVAKRDDDFSDLDVKIDVPKIDMSSLDVSVQ